MKNLVKKATFCLFLIFSLIACSKDENGTSINIIGDWTQINIEPSEKFQNQSWEINFITETTFDENFIDTENSINEDASGNYTINGNILTTTYTEGTVNDEAYSELAINYFYHIISLKGNVLKIAFLGDDDVEGENNIKSLAEASELSAKREYISVITLVK